MTDGCSMRTLTALAALAACGSPHVAVTPPPAPAHARPPPLARTTPPSCPLPAAPPSDVDDSRPADTHDARRDTPAHGDRREVADTNLARVEAAILRAHDEASAPAPRVASAPWDRKRPPAYDSLVTARLALDADEHAHLARDGFVVLPRVTFASYASAFHEIYQSQLPIYISIDAVMHAVYAGNDGLIADIEDRVSRAADRAHARQARVSGRRPAAGDARRAAPRSRSLRRGRARARSRRSRRAA